MNTLKKLTKFNEGFENNAYKQIIREKILHQSTFLNDCVDSFHNFNTMTLCGETCKLEHMFAKKYTGTKTLLSMHCAENDARKIETIKENLPSQSTIELGDFNKIICKGIKTGDETEFDLIWADYTSACTPILIERLSHYAHVCLKDQGLIYVTFWIKGRTGKQGLADLATSGTILPDVSNPSSNKMSNKELKNSILKLMQASFRKRGLKMKNVLDIMYSSGANESTPMVTLGFSKNISPKDPNYVKPLKMDLIKAIRVAKRINKRKTINTVREKAFELFKQNIPTQTIKELLGLSSAQVGAYKAHYNKQGVPWHIKDRKQEA